MKNVSIWRKIKLYLEYRRSITKNRLDLLEKGIRIDRVKRLYTVINIPEDLYDSYGLKSSDISRVSKTYITEALKQIRDLLNTYGLNELYRVYDTKKVDKYSYLIVIGYNLFDTQKIANIFWYIILPTTALISIITLLMIYI